MCYLLTATAIHMYFALSPVLTSHSLNMKYQLTGGHGIDERAKNVLL